MAVRLRDRRAGASGRAWLCAVLLACCLLTGCAEGNAPGVAAPDHLAGAGRIGTVPAASGWGATKIQARRPACTARRATRAISTPARIRPGRAAIAVRA